MVAEVPTAYMNNSIAPGLTYMVILHACGQEEAHGKITGQVRGGERCTE